MLLNMFLAFESFGASLVKKNFLLQVLAVAGTEKFDAK
jgi:hypothetical protein